MNESRMRYSCTAGSVSGVGGEGGLKGEAAVR